MARNQTEKQDRLICYLFRAPNSTSEVQNKIESSLDLAYDTDTSNIIITGDFNYNYLNTADQRKATSLFEPYGLVQLIDEPTHYTQSSE